MNVAAKPSYLQYTLTLRSPAIVTSLSGDPNSAMTQPFIPGASLRGALAGRLIAPGTNGDGADFHRLILSGAIRYLHAYPELGGNRAIPVPASWQSEKDNPYSAFDLAAFSGEVVPEDDEGDWPRDPLSRPPGAFAAPSAAKIVATPDTRARLHQQRDRVRGRPWKDDDEQQHGAIFSYEYLQEEQVFRGVIQVLPEASSEIERIKSALQAAPLLLGRSRRAGYGGEAEITFHPSHTDREYPDVTNPLTTDIAKGTHFRVLLTSSYIGRNNTGQIDPCALDQELLHRLGQAAKIERLRWAFEIVGGFNQKWRLEVPQALAVQGGAVLVLQATQPIPLTTVRQIEHEGVGERRVEGFGRILFLKHDEDQDPMPLEESKNRILGEAATAHALSQPEQAQLDRLERHIVLAAARDELDRIATHDLARAAKRRPTSSLLGRVRTLFRGVVNEQSAQAALTNLAVWCDSDNENALKERARKQLQDCSLGQGSLLAWFTRVAGVRTGEEGWQTLKTAVGSSAVALNGIPERHHLTSLRAAESQLQSHAAELTVYLIDAVLAALSRQNRRGGQ